MSVNGTFFTQSTAGSKGFFRETNNPSRNGTGLKQVNIYKQPSKQKMNKKQMFHILL